MQSREERIARNDAAFREANEQIADYAGDHEFVDKVPFICECAAESCLMIIDLSLAEYENVRSSPTRFFVAPGHQASEGSGAIIDDRGSYVLIEKSGRAGEIARDLDPRSRPDSHRADGFKSG
jgi:hypothetical protein